MGPQRDALTAGAADPAGDAPVPDPFGRRDPPVLTATLWPNRSLGRRGFVAVMVLVVAGFALPLLRFAGTPVALGLLPFVGAATGGLWLAIRRSNRDGALTEELRLWPDLITLERRDPRGGVRRWHADPFWVRLQLFENARIEKYLTLSGNGREVELGAFLSPPERVALHADLAAALTRLRSSGRSGQTRSAPETAAGDPANAADRRGLPDV